MDTGGRAAILLLTQYSRKPLNARASAKDVPMSSF